MEKYKAKFVKLNALDKFEAEEVQALVADTLDAEKVLDAKNALSDMLIELIDAVPAQTSVNAKQNGFVEPSGSLGNLVNKQKKVIKDTDIYDGKVIV